jgi:hypothetical protein
MRVPTLLVIVLAPGVIALTPIDAGSQSLERAVYATVVNRAGAPVDDLLAADFVVKENGSALEVLSVSRAVDPVDIAVLVNTGDGDIWDVRRGLVDLFNGIQAPHDMALTGLARPAVKVDYTRDAETFVRGVNALSLRGAHGENASVRDAVLDASRALQKRRASRRAIIVVSDGSFLGRANRGDDVRAALRKSGATLYVVVIERSELPYTFPNGDPHISQLSVNDAVPNASGGRVVYVLASTGVSTAFAEIAGDINHQYRVDYERPASAATPNSLDVSVRQTGLAVRATRLPPE